MREENSEGDMIELFVDVIMLYLDEYARIFPNYESSFRNIKLLLTTNEKNYEGLISVYETLDKGPTNSLEHFMDVVLFDKVCKAIGEEDRAIGAVEFMSKSFVEEKNRLKREIEEYEEEIQMRYQSMNEEYMGNYSELTTNIAELRRNMMRDIWRVRTE